MVPEPDPNKIQPESLLKPVAYPGGGAKGPWPPPNRKVRGQTIIWPPPFEVNRIFFFKYTLLFILYLITRKGNSHVTTFSNNVCLFVK